ncbi:ABC transporter substrate-binding protein [Agromyces endophyticus]|uniref:ABC transporter substrate-binding protein n=1 Tax=Agromyces sp. H17E-10 TaxID=2932244 RepID=UPI001FD2ECD1|nr:ABC transporter substrate-binding protein [Agromyces sp. H17E-10]UOQ89184.1 ABC transporter substrate-binding protein [Agromyces sp. H17E-10]
MTNITWRRSAATAAALLTAGIMLAGCTGKPHETNGTTDGLDLPTAAPPATTDVDLVTWNLSGGEPATLDPVKAFSGSDLQVSANLCESLLTMTDTGDIQPGLASSIDQPSPTEYVVHLRDGVTFTDGTPMTSDDVVYSLNRIRDPEAGSYWGYFAERVESVTAVDASTVKIDMSQPDAVFYRMLVTPVGQVIQKAFAEEAGETYGTPTGGVMCTGPYTLANWTPGDSITLEANPNWWKIGQQPLRTKSAKFTFLTEDATITSALVNGDIDGSMDIASTSLPQLLNAPNGEMYAGPSTRQFVIIPTDLSADSASPLADPKIRQALAKSIDYQGLLTTVWAGLSEPLRTIVPPGAWGYSKEIYQTAYDEFSDPARDIEGAKALLKEAGNPNPKIVLAVPADFPQYVTIGESIQSNAKDAGFDIELRALPGAESNALFSDPDARAKVDAFISDYFSDIPDPTELYMQLGVPDGASNFNSYDNPEVAALLEEARGTADDDARAELTVKAQATITEDLVWIPVSYPLQSVFLNNRLGGMTAAFPAALYTPWLAFLGGR